MVEKNSLGKQLATVFEKRNCTENLQTSGKHKKKSPEIRVLKVIVFFANGIVDLLLSYMDDNNITLPKQLNMKTFKYICPLTILACYTGWFIFCWKVEETWTISVRTSITALHPETISSPSFERKITDSCTGTKTYWQGNFVRPRVFPSAKTPRTIAKGPRLRYSRFIFHRIF